jgi:hypothetical protein
MDPGEKVVDFVEKSESEFGSEFLPNAAQLSPG